MLDIHSAENEKPVHGPDELTEVSRVPRRRYIPIALGLLGITAGFILLDRFHYKNLRAEEKAKMQEVIDASSQSLQDMVASIGLDDNFTVTITDDVDWAGDPEAELEVIYGNCTADIPLRETARAYVTDGTLPYNWDRAENGGEDNLLAIPDEFGNVLGYLTLTAENIEASFPAECAK